MSRLVRGFTMVEALVAFLITALILSVLVRGIGLTSLSEAGAQRMLEATNRAQNHLQTIGVERPLVAGERRWQTDNDFSWLESIVPWSERDGLVGRLSAFRVVVEVREHSTSRLYVRLETIKLSVLSADP